MVKTAISFFAMHRLAKTYVEKVYVQSNADVHSISHHTLWDIFVVVLIAIDHVSAVQRLNISVVYRRTSAAVGFPSPS